MRLVSVSHLVCAVLTCLPATGLAAEKLSASWPQWRGPNRDGRIDQPAWPRTLSNDSLQQAWRVQLGPSYSGPIVTADRVFVTETKDSQFEVVRAINRTTGKQIWQTQWEGAMRVPFFAAANGSWIRATPAYDGRRVYVAGMRDVLVCLDAATGKRIWKVDFVKQLKTPLPNFGFVSSPLIVGNHLFVQAGASLAKLDKRTGKILWRTLRDRGGMWGSAFSSPTLAKLHGKQQLVVLTRQSLAGVSLKTGQVRWSRKIPAFRGMNILTPTIVGNSVFTSSYGGRSLLFNISGSSQKQSIREAWNNKAQGYMSSPVVIDGHIYLHLRNRRACCIDVATGETRWTTKPFGKYWSMVANSKQILALDERGELLLIAANPNKFELIDRKQVSEQSTWAHLAVCGNQVFVRDIAGLSVYRWHSPAGQKAKLDR